MLPQTLKADREVQKRTRQAFLARGFPTDLIEKIASNGHNVGILKSSGKKKLQESYNDDEVALIRDRVIRKGIAPEILASIIAKSAASCCYCGDGNASRPYQIHHIEEHALTQDDSEDNLMLICPTHHVSVPKSDSVNQQKNTRRSWYSTVKIAENYASRSIAFPFGVFVAVNYESVPDPAEPIFSYGVSPSTAVAMSSHALADELLAKLIASEFELVIGMPGSGKTTVAMGTAGRIAAEQQRLVFLYRSLDSNDSLAEIFTFIDTVTRPVVLVIDDANKFPVSYTHLTLPTKRIV